MEWRGHGHHLDRFIPSPIHEPQLAGLPFLLMNLFFILSGVQLTLLLIIE